MTACGVGPMKKTRSETMKKHSELLDRSSGRTLAEQLEVVLRRGILSGRWPTGSFLPKRSELCATYGIGDNTVRSAIARLTAAGFVRSRRHLGCEVLRRGARKLVCRVLHILTADIGSYPHAVFSMSLRSSLNAAGIAVSTVAAPDGKSRSDVYDFIDREIEARPDLCLVQATNLAAPSIMRRLEAAGIPYLLVNCESRRKGRYCLGTVFGDSSGEALGEFVADCRAAKIRSVCRVAFGVDWELNPQSLLEGSGILQEDLCLSDDAKAGSLQKIMEGARDMVTRRLRRGPLCDMLFFTDDYLTFGAMPALLEAGVRIPEDVRVVTLLNRGFGPVFSKSFACIENDPMGSAKRLSSAVVSWYSTGVFSLQPIVRRYIRGETFPVKF